MNIAMEQTEEYVNGQLKANYGECFIRGNNGESVIEGSIDAGDGAKADRAKAKGQRGAGTVRMRVSLRTRVLTILSFLASQQGGCKCQTRRLRKSLDGTIPKPPFFQLEVVPS